MFISDVGFDDVAGPNRNDGQRVKSSGSGQRRIKAFDQLDFDSAKDADYLTERVEGQRQQQPGTGKHQHKYLPPKIISTTTYYPI